MNRNEFLAQLKWLGRHAAQSARRNRSLARQADARESDFSTAFYSGRSSAYRDVLIRVTSYLRDERRRA